MQILTDNKNLSVNEKCEIEKLLSIVSKMGTSDLEQMWYLMDSIWDDYKCNNIDLDMGKLGEFYSHPVWLLNGLFIEQHDLSMQHRHAISDWIIQNDFKLVVDYGGGFGTLARLIAKKDRQITVDIYEPYPAQFGIKRTQEFDNVSLIDNLDLIYDCLVSTDVLEHVSDPLTVLSQMVNSIKPNGYLVIANCFSPVIKCHLPRNFHFRYTFRLFAKAMGLVYVGPLKNSHATIYLKENDVEVNWRIIRIYEKVSALQFVFIKKAQFIIDSIKLCRDFFIK